MIGGSGVIAEQNNNSNINIGVNGLWDFTANTPAGGPEQAGIQYGWRIATGVAQPYPTLTVTAICSA